jgi:hypothetical protein
MDLVYKRMLTNDLFTDHTKMRQKTITEILVERYNKTKKRKHPLLH